MATETGRTDEGKDAATDDDVAVVAAEPADATPATIDLRAADEPAEPTTPPKRPIRGVLAIAVTVPSQLLARLGAGLSGIDPAATGAH